MKTYDVLIADDSERARQAIRMMLGSTEQFQVVAEAKNGLDACEKAKTYMPDLVLMDINMPDMDGLRATREIKQALPYITVVILSVSDDAADLFEAIRSGAQGYMLKSLEPTDWLSYLNDILDGDTPLSKTMAERILTEFLPAGGPQTAPESRYQDLTNREREILDFVKIGATNREIAARLFISENTVKNHLKNIMAKLQIQNRVQLATYAHRNR